MKFVIEHLEPELYDWCLIEYQHISKIVGKGNLIFTNINKKDVKKFKKYGVVYEKSISGLKLDSICVLSQYSKKTLTTNDKNKFQYFVFGGILGDNPSQKRTQQLINELKNKIRKNRRFSEHQKSKGFFGEIKFEARNLGDKQMPTDIAVYVAKKILEGKKFHEMKFFANVEIEINENESVTLPFRYVVDNNKLIINEKLVKYLRKRKEF